MTKLFIIDFNKSVINLEAWDQIINIFTNKIDNQKNFIKILIPRDQKDIAMEKFRALRITENDIKEIKYSDSFNLQKTIQILISEVQQKITSPSTSVKYIFISGDNIHFALLNGQQCVFINLHKQEYLTKLNNILLSNNKSLSPKISNFFPYLLLDENIPSNDKQKPSRICNCILS